VRVGCWGGYFVGTTTDRTGKTEREGRENRERGRWEEGDRQRGKDERIVTGEGGERETERKTEKDTARGTRE
jgi:hypothetical protein